MVVCSIIHVSILVLVDVGLRPITVRLRVYHFNVSILVLVDVGLRQLQRVSCFNKGLVSILVLVDVGLRQICPTVHTHTT